MTKKKSFQYIRSEQYKQKIGVVPYIIDWRHNPYTCFKSFFYIEISSVLVFFLLKTRIKPNTITVIYGLSGIIGGIFLAIPNNITIGIGVLIFFLKGIFDWGDGLLARLTDQESLTGHILDVYGAKLGSLTFFIGLGFYVASKTEMLLFYYLIPLIPLFNLLALTQFGKAQLFDTLSSKKRVEKWKKKKDEVQLEQGSTGNSLVELSKKKYYDFVVSVLDDRARTVDLICLVILLEMFYPLNLTWIFFLLLTIKWVVVFLGSFYLLSKGGWAENTLDAKLTELFNMLRDHKRESL